MSLEDWLKNGWLVEHKTSAAEIAELLAITDRDLADCRVQGLSPDWRLNIAAMQLSRQQTRHWRPVDTGHPGKLTTTE